MEAILYVILDAILGGLILWVASKITTVDLAIRETIIAAGAAALASLIPDLGWFLSIVILFYLLKKFSQADIWPDLLLMVIVSRGIAFLAILALGGL